MLTIAWDVDDILNNLMYEWFLNFKEGNPRIKDIDYNDLIHNPPQDILEISKLEYLESLDQFRLATAYKSSVPNPEVLSWFEEHGEKANHIALTAVPVNCVHASAEWVMSHFGKWIRSFNYIPSSRAACPVKSYDSSKAVFLKRVGIVDILVEDNQKNVTESEEIGVKGVLVSRPWNSSQTTLRESLNIILREIEDR